MTPARIVAFAIALLTAGAAYAQVGDTELIRSYVGTFEGRGVALYETGGYDAVACRVGFEPGSAGKIVLRNSFCQVAGTELKFTGTMAFMDGRYQAAVTSNVGFKGRTVGRREGDAIVFTLEDGELVDRSLGLAATFIMAGGAIVVDMKLTSNVTGAITQVRVPLQRR